MGIDPLIIGEYTVREISALAKRKGAERESEMTALIANAWYSEAFARTKRLPKLNVVLRKIQTKKAKESRGDLLLKAMAKSKGVNIGGDN